jgi:outer membrane receptor for ferrienterochelin and colicin
MRKCIFILFFSLFQLQVLNAQTPDFSETELMFFGEETVSAVSRKKEPLYLAPSVVTVIHRDEILKKGFQTLSDVLKTVPGFYVEHKEDRKIVYCRGIADSILVIIDGVPQIYDSARSYIPVDRELSLLNVKKIEISRGPQTATWGPNALTGVVNIVTMSGSDLDSVIASAGIGSADDKVFNIAAGKDFETFELYGSASVRFSREPSLFFKNAPQQYMIIPPIFTIETRKSGYGQNEEDSFVEIYTKAKYKYLEFSLKYSDFTDYSQLSSFSHGILPAGRNSHYGAKTLFSQGTAEKDFGKFHLKGQIFSFRQKGNDTLRLFPQDTGHAFSGASIISSSLTNIGTNLQTDVDISASHKLTAGIQAVFNQTSVTSDFEDPVTGSVMKSAERDAENIILSIYSQYDLLIGEKWDFTLGMSFDKHSDFEGAFNPKAVVSLFPVKDFGFKLLYGQAIRTPDQFDLFGIMRGVFFGNITEAKENENLKPERIYTVQASSMYFPDKETSLDLTLFYSHIADRIEKTAVKEMITAVNQGSNDFIGLEFNSKAELFPHFKGYLSYSFIAGYDEKGRRYYSVPEHTGSIGMTWDRYSFLETGITVSAVSAPANVSAPHSSDRLWAYSATDANISFKALDNAIKLSLLVKNLFDNDYYNRNEAEPGINEEVLIPGQPRTFLLTLTGKM